MTPPKRRSALAAAAKERAKAAVFDAQIKAQRKAEADLWRDLWKMPQAIQWEKLRWTRDIAQYVRHKAKAELGSIEDAKEARAQADRFGLTPMSLLRLRWEIIGPAEVIGLAERRLGRSARNRRGPHIGQPLTAVPDLAAPAGRGVGKAEED